MITERSGRLLGVILAAVALLAAACGGSEDGGATDEGSITVYSGREKELVEQVFERFTAETGIRIDVRYGDTAELAAQILEEGDNTPADVFFAQDAGALGALSARGRFTTLDASLVDPVPDGFRAQDGSWVGVTGRARTVVYNTDALSEADLPGSILGFADPSWEGKIGWAPQNGSFQAFVTGLRKLEGDDDARAWLRGIVANGVTEYPKNTPIVQAVGAGEIEVGFVNHYYLLRLLAEDPALPAANHFFGGGDPGALVNVAGIGILSTTDAPASARRFIGFLLDTDTQSFFSETTFEYPLVTGVPADPRLPPLEQLEPPALDLSKLSDLEETLTMLREEGLL